MKVLALKDIPPSFDPVFEKTFLNQVIPLGNCIFRVTSVNGKKRKLTLELSEVAFPTPEELKANESTNSTNQ